jgi:gliding motility-associated-like protein
LNDQPVSDPTSVSDPGLYVVTVTDANGCSDEAAATVTAVECLCEADFIHDASCIQDPAQFTLIADSTVLSASWDFDGAATNSTAVDPMVIITSEGDVLVTLQATLSCGVVEVQHMIQMQDCSDLCSVWIPSAFTPDNDGRNDTWAWYGECEPEDFKVEVYDRWGEVIFASNDPFTSWDGKYNGTLSPSGVYAYRVGYRLPYQKRKEVAGSITMLR